MTQFEVEINDRVYNVTVYAYSPARPWRQHTFRGAGPGDCDPPEDEVFEYTAWDADTGQVVELTMDEENMVLAAFMAEVNINEPTE